MAAGLDIGSRIKRAKFDTHEGAFLESPQAAE
jgi:hypothetical protein